MDNNKSDITVSEHDLRVLVKALAKSVRYIHTKYVVMTFIAGLLIGFGAAVLIMNLMGLSQQTLPDANVLLRKIDETIRKEQQVQPATKNFTAAKIGADDKKGAERNASPMPQTKGRTVQRVNGESAFAGTKVYIHYARAKDKKMAEAFSSFLEKRGYVSVSTEQIRHWKRDIRYFHDEDEDSALLLKKHLKDFLVRSPKSAGFQIGIKNLSARYPHAQKGAIEMWVYF